MSQSYLLDIQQILGKDKAEEYLKEINQDPFENTKNQVKNMFSHLQDEDIVEILKKYNNNTDAAFDELMDRNSQMEENKKRERKLEEEKRRAEIYNKYIDTFVRNFQMFDTKEIEMIFKNNNNDPQVTTNQLYLMMKEREQKNEEAKKLKRELEIQNMQSGFSEKFAELTKEEIIEVINQHDLEFEKIAFDLEKMQKQKIFDELFIQFYTSFSSEEIRQALEKNNWAIIDTKKVLQKKQTEIEFKKQIEKIEREKLSIPKLEYNEKQLENLKEESNSKMIDVKKMLETEELKNEEETKKNIENMIIENSNPEVPSENTQNECSIEVTVQDTKIVAHIDFKNQNSYSWIGFYSKEDKDGNYKFYNYLCKLTENKFVVDKPLLNGTYQFRVFLSKYISVKVSEDIILDKKDVVKMVRDEKNDKVTIVSWEMGTVDPVAVGAYVTIHKKEEERANYYRRWNWIKTFSGSHSFKTPIHTGEYEARVYFNGKAQFKSESFKIEGI